MMKALENATDEQVKLHRLIVILLLNSKTIKMK